MLKPRKKAGNKAEKEQAESQQPDSSKAALIDDIDKKREQAKAHTEKVKASQAERSKALAECGPIPKPKHQRLRNKYKYDLKGFVERYLPKMFKDIKRKWAGFHIECFERVQFAILNDGQFAEALPRGSAKSTMMAAAVIWAACYGHRRYAVVICASDPLADKFLHNVKRQFEVQKLLGEDFPEICIPIRHLEGKTQKCNSQTVDGVRTMIEWTQDHLVLPTVKGSKASGFRFETSGLTGSGCRGLLTVDAEGEFIRPDLVILDDPQTNESARSPVQCEARMGMIEAILNLEGPGDGIAVFACVTVIREGDVAEKLIEKPDWQAVRVGILDKMPNNEQLSWWEQYRDIQIDSYNRRLGREPELKFYRDNQAAIEGELKPTWPDRFNAKHEINGIHHAINQYYKAGPETFASDFMNRPLPLTEAMVFRLDPLQVRNRLTKLKRGCVPVGFDFITLGVDVQESIIFFVVMAWKWDLTGTIIDYGCVPKQIRREFTLKTLDKTLQSESGSIEDLDAAVSWGLVELGQYFTVQSVESWKNEIGHPVIAKAGQIDINFRKTETAVSRFCLSGAWKHIFMPAMGQGTGEDNWKTRVSEWQAHAGQNWPKPLERRECEWMETNPRQHGCREVYFDANHWKGYVNTALALPLHSSGSISIFGENPEEHRQLSTHLTSHYSEDRPLKGEVRTVWLKRDGVRDDLLDCVVECAVAASRLGARLKRTAILPRVEETVSAYPEHLVKSKGWNV